ncbi:MAG: PEP-CTERM sorting domain-containing protein [Planctomycetota bacterium]
MHKLTLLAAAATFAAGSVASAQIASFNFDAAADNGDGTFSGLDSFTGPGSDFATIGLSTVVDGTTAITGDNSTDNDGFGFSILVQNFTSTPAGGVAVPFNQLLEGGGTLTGQAVIIDSGSGDTDGQAQIFLARNGAVTGFDLTDSDDNDDNFNFTGSFDEGAVIDFSFTLPNITGTNNLDSGGFYGIQLGASGLGEDAGDAVVAFDNIVFTPIPEPTSLGLLGVAGLALARRRR